MPLATSRIALHPHVPAPRRQASAGTVAIKEALLQHPASSLQAMLELAVRHNDIPTARHALQQGAAPEHLIARTDDDDMRALLVLAHRKNLLYPSHIPYVRETDLDYALRNVLDDRSRQEADDLLSQAIDGKTLPEAWRDAVWEEEPAIQRAILLLRADQDRNFRLLEQNKPFDDAVARVMKEIPYFPPKRRSPQNLNGAVMFQDKKTKEEIVCRHLVEHRQAAQAESDELKFDYLQYLIPANIAAHVSPDTDAKHCHLMAHAAEAHLFHNRDFGKTLVQNLASMMRKKETTRLLLLASTNHAMSVGLKIKDKHGKPYYMAELFDPNITTSHVRVASRSLHTLESLTLKNFIVSKDLYKDYYPELDDLSMTFVRSSSQEEQAMANPAPGAVENRVLTNCIEDKKIDAVALFFMLANGFSGDLRRLKHEIARRPEEEQIRLLTAKKANGVPGLYAALYDGHADAIRAFGELLNLIRSEKARVELLTAKNANGIPWLFMVLQNGNADTIKAFAELLKLVPPKARIELLAAKIPSDGRSWLAKALEEGNLKALDQYIEIVKKIAPSLNARERSALLKDIRKSHAKHKKGMWWSNYQYYDVLKKNNPDFYSRFKEMKSALKS